MGTIVGPAKSWRLVHDGVTVLSLAEMVGYTETINQVFEAATQSECNAEATRLGLVQPVVVPEAVTMRQARLALMSAGLLSTVNTIVAGMTGPAGDAARIEWEFSSTVERHRGLVSQLGSALGLTETQVDALFVTASTL